MVASMLGRFLEFSTSVPSVLQEAQFYRSLGFEDLPTADFVNAPYAALWDGTAFVGLYELESAETMLTFVRQELAVHSRTLRRRGLEFEEIALGDDQFNRAIARTPGGQAIALLEARTFSTATRDPSRMSACGEFVEFSLPTHSVEEATAFWSNLGFDVVAASQAPHRSVRLEGLGLTVGFHQTRLAPGLSYRSPDFSARTDYLRARGFVPERGAATGLADMRAATLTSPSGLKMYLHESAG